MPTGTIARLLIDKGFGFIRDEGGNGALLPPQLGARRRVRAPARRPARGVSSGRLGEGAQSRRRQADRELAASGTPGPARHVGAGPRPILLIRTTCHHHGSERGPVALPVFKIGCFPLVGKAGFDSQALPPTQARFSPWRIACFAASMDSKNAVPPALEPDTWPEGVHQSDRAPLRLIPMPDRRKQRMRTPTCSRCGWDDDVSVVARSERSLTWRCSRCSWSWTVPLAPRSQ